MPAGTIPRIVPLAVAALMGAALVQGLPALPPTWMLCAVPLIAALVTLRWPKSLSPKVLLTLALFFAWTAWIADARIQQRLPLSMVGTQAMVEGRVIGFPRALPHRTEFDLNIHSADNAPRLQGKTLRVRWFGEVPELRAGSRWRMVLRLQDPRGTSNPGSYDMQRQMLLDDVHGLAYVRDAGLAMQFERGDGLHALRAELADRMMAAAGRQDTRFTRALSIGDTRDLSDEDWRLLRLGGLSHLVAISGFHVGMVAAFAGLLMIGLYRLLPMASALCQRPRAVTLTAALAAIAYAAMAGFAVATVRTALMIGVIAALQWLRRADGAVQSFCVALLVVLAFDPLAVLDAGFWLSFIGVAGLLLCLPMRRLRGREWLAAYVRTQWITYLVLLPLCLWFFAENSWLSPLVNLIAIPLVSLVLVPLSLLGAALLLPLPGLSLALLEATAKLCDNGLRALAMLDSGSWAQGVSWISSVPMLLLLCLGSALMLVPKQRWLQACGALCWLPVLLPMQSALPPGAVQVTAFDVGRVQSVLVETREHSMLYLSGSKRDLSPSWFEDLGRLLQVHGVRGIDVVIAPREQATPDAFSRRFPHAHWLSPEGEGAARCGGPQAWYWEGVRLRVLHPPKYFPDEGVDSRCVLWVEAGAQRALVTPGLSKPMQRRLLNRHPEIAGTTLWVTHERAKERWDPDFVAALSDARVWWSDRVRGPGPTPASEPSSPPERVREQGQLRAVLRDAAHARQGITTRRHRDFAPRYWQAKLTD